MVEVASVYDAVPVPRTAADIVTPPGQERRGCETGLIAAGKPCWPLYVSAAGMAWLPQPPFSGR